jgi:aminomethyltransferase
LESLPGEYATLWQKLKYYGAVSEDMHNVSALVSRTGYTGEDGCELILPSVEQTVAAWDNLMQRGAQVHAGLRPCGLGARDTLRLEAAMPLYGHELSEAIDPFTAGLSFAVKLDKPDFIGQSALVEMARRTDRPVRVGLKFEGRRIAREGCAVLHGEERIGEITSGSFSPTLQQPIAMAYVAPKHAAAGTTVDVDVRGKREHAVIVALPFYKRAT